MSKVISQATSLHEAQAASTALAMCLPSYRRRAHTTGIAQACWHTLPQTAYRLLPLSLYPCEAASGPSGFGSRHQVLLCCMYCRHPHAGVNA